MLSRFAGSDRRGALAHGRHRDLIAASPQPRTSDVFAASARHFRLLALVFVLLALPAWQARGEEVIDNWRALREQALRQAPAGERATMLEQFAHGDRLDRVWREQARQSDDPLILVDAWDAAHSPWSAVTVAAPDDARIGRAVRAADADAVLLFRIAATCAAYDAPAWCPPYAPQVRLTEIAADNAANWLLRASIAHNRGDAKEFEYAFLQAAQAPRIDVYYGAMIRRILQFGRRMNPKLSGWEVETRAIGTAAAAPAPYLVLTAACGTLPDAAPPAAHIEQACRAIARTMAFGGTTLTDLDSGARLLQRLAQTEGDRALAAKAEARKRELYAVMPLAAEDVDVATGNLRPGREASFTRWIEEIATFGEIGAIERRHAQRQQAQPDAAAPAPIRD